MKKVYIAGRITGMEEKAFSIFENAEKYISNNELLCSLEIVNPMKLPHNHDRTWASYMKECIKNLCDCDYIFMLSNWKESKGAIIEHDIAKNLQINIIYEQK